MTESRLQSDCFIWFWNTYPEHRRMLFHVNNKARNRIEGAKFKAMGVVKGVSDLILILPGKVLFIELKEGDGRQTPEQKDFQGKVEIRGHEYHIVKNFEEFKSLVKLYLKLYNPYT